MPDVTVSPELHHVDLKTVEGAFVKLRQLPYYEMLVRRDKGSIASMEQATGKRDRSKPQTTKMMIESLQTWERHYMFKQCIAEHNLTDSEGQPLNFNNENTLRYLRPDVGSEIERAIDDLNSEGEDDVEDFPNAASKSSEQVNPEPLTFDNMDSVKN